MSGHKSFNELTKDWSEERRNRVKKQTEVLAEEMTLSELRKVLDVKQQEIADHLKVKQPAVARLLGRSDMHVSNLRRLIESLGGELDIHARFPEGDVKITNLGEQPQKDFDEQE